MVGCDLAEMGRQGGKGNRQMGKYRENARYNVLSLRVTEEEHKEVKEMAHRLNISISETLHMKIFGKI